MNLKYVLLQDKERYCPLFYINYIFDLINCLRNSGYSCEIGSEYCGIINYADDIVLIIVSIIKMGVYFRHLL